MKKPVFILTAAASLAFSSMSTQAAIVISEIDLLNNKVELVNTGTSAVDITGYFICNRFNGSPFYTQITLPLVDTVNSTANSLSISSGSVLTVNLTASIVPDASGEIGLYLNGSNFGSSANIVDYVAWGANAARDNVAAAAGIWGDGTFVTVSTITAGQTIQLKQGLAGNVLGDYELAASTIGVNQVPEPTSTVLIAALGMVGILRRQRAYRS
jgi:PEP-CTERM motif